MFSFIKKYLRRHRPRKPDVVYPNDEHDVALQKDAGIRVTRIRLPSGRELVVIHRDDQQ
ncbi:hypothetical protein [Gilvimarinus algae]|uniref:Uncharacterized protein n=1 Tax=Gilvimarinus algae TaxID=3058037 RepID=A0ABT8TBB2_9GAMM|nr:hypothetical protein [Gilvimarinus sp. SDUM040014]MDO3380874.1 hypothetical protein [Gilvimarinus sp. SDUM040014]